MEMRVVSLVPSLTELLISLGVHVVGRTRFCIHPANHIKDIPIIGGTKNPNCGKIKECNPDLVIANKEENRREDVNEISTFCRTLVTEVSTIQEALKTIVLIGDETQTKTKAVQLVDEIKQHLIQVDTIEPRSAAYLIWINPWMTIGNDTYIHDVMKQFGLRNVYGSQSRYPEISIESLKACNPGLILLSSEPYPFSQKHVVAMTEELPNAQILLVNGEWFSWYGSRMKPAFEELAKWRFTIE